MAAAMRAAALGISVQVVRLCMYDCAQLYARDDL